MAKEKCSPEKKLKSVSPQGQLLRKQILVGFLIVLAISLLLTAVWYVTRVESLQIKQVEVVGGFTIPHNEIVEIANRELDGTYFRLIPKRFSLLYPDDSIEVGIMSINRVKEVRQERQGQTLHLAFDEHQPYALWCEEADSAECWFIDKAGLSFATAPNLTGGAFVRFLTDEAPEKDSIMGESGFINRTADFVEALEDEIGLYTTHISKVDDLDIEYQVAGGGRIKVSQSMSAVESINNLKAILTAPEFEHIEPGSFNYIDLRFGDKVFVSEEILEEVSTSTASSTTVE